jgi:predicted RNase H-like HicB family nuclease
MENDLELRIERLPEGPYLATSEKVQGLVVQAATVAEVIEIAKDIAQKLREAGSH